MKLCPHPFYRAHASFWGGGGHPLLMAAALRGMTQPAMPGGGRRGN